MIRRQQMIARRETGFSLVELMVALVLSLVLLAGALSILYSSKLTNTENDRLSRLQEAGRTVVELMLRDARAAGYPGCSRPVFGDEFANGLLAGASSPTPTPTQLASPWNFSIPVYGFNATGGAWLPALDTTWVPGDSTPGSDVVMIRTTRQGLPVFRTTAAVTNTAAALQVERPSGATLPANTATAGSTSMIISDCSGAATFMATGFTAGSATTATIAHAVGAGSFGNSDDDLARGGFGIGSLVMPIQTVIYYVRNSNTAGVGPTLWQRIGNAAPQELVQGVENLQLSFGVDTDDDMLVNEYRVASAVTDWSDVVSMSLAVLVRSPEEAGVERDNRTYNLLGTNVGPFNDRRHRAVFTTTVVLRNRTT